MRRYFNTAAAKLGVALYITLNLLLPQTALSEPSNLTLVKNEIRSWYDAGLYDKDLDHTIHQAQQYLLKQVQLNKASAHPKKLALVLDIDETSLSNYAFIKQHDFTSDQALIDNNILSAQDDVIAPTLKLYNEAVKQGVRVFFVTGRRDNTRKATITNLKKAGYAGWSGLYLKPQNDKKHSNIPFKSQARADIEAKGYVIVANIGDQYSDLLGGHALKTFKLPNPFYYLP